MRAAGNDRAARSAIVAGEDDQRIVAQAPLVERGDDSPDLVVDRRNHRRIGAARRILDGGRVAVLIGLLCLVGRMRGQRREVQEERLVLVLLLDHLDCFVADQRQVVSLLLEEFPVALPVHDAAAHLGEIVHLADEVSVKVIEAAILRPELLVGMAQVPLADHRGAVAGLFQSLRQRPFVGRQAVSMVREDHQRLQAVTHWIAARHQRRARRGADRHAVEGFEPHPFVGKFVDIRCLDVAAAIAEIGVAEIVSQDHDDVRRSLLSLYGAQGQPQVNSANDGDTQITFRDHGVVHSRARWVQFA